MCVKKGKTMFEEKINLSQIPDLLVQTGIAPIISVQNGQTRDNARPRLEITGPFKRVFEVDETVLSQIESGNIDTLMQALVKTSPRFINKSFSAPALLELPEFRAACLSEINPRQPLSPNKFLAAQMSDPGKIPVFYGSTAGINFAEVVETALCAQTIFDQGSQSGVLFDYESKNTPKSQEIFVNSRTILPSYLQERVDNFIKDTEGGLIGARLRATRLLLQDLSLPKFQFIDGRDIFANLSGDFPFSIGQLLLMAKMAGDPKLILSTNTQGKEFSFNSADIAKQLDSNPFVGLSTSVTELLKSPRRPAGFAYYARDARIALFEGVIGIPFKLTEMANIYKILYPIGGLYNQDSNRGAILLPIQRQRILYRLSPSSIKGEAVDPVALYVLASDQMSSFINLMADFRSNCRVLTPDEAIKSGTTDNKMFIDQYFNLKELS